MKEPKGPLKQPVATSPFLRSRAWAPTRQRTLQPSRLAPPPIPGKPERAGDMTVEYAGPDTPSDASTGLVDRSRNSSAPVPGLTGFHGTASHPLVQRSKKGMDDMKHALAKEDEDDDRDDGPTEDEMAAAYEEFMADPNLGVRFYNVDPAAGGAHAYDRHTAEGIFEQGAILSAHPHRVAIFDSEDAFYAALAAMPDRQDAWYHPAGAAAGRYDAQVGDVHYQATLLGDTMSLLSCYPTDADHQWTRAEVQAALDAGGDLAAFQQALNNA